MSRLKNRINFSVMVLVGVALAIAGVYFYVKMDTFMKTSLVANGIVTKLHATGDGMITPVVEFIDTNGEKLTFTSKSSSTNPKYELNQAVKVVYIQNSSKTSLEAYIYDEWNIFIRKYALLAFGLFFILLGVVFGRLFWNRDSMHISYNFSKTYEFENDRKNKNL